MIDPVCRRLCLKHGDTDAEEPNKKRQLLLVSEKTQCIIGEKKYQCGWDFARRNGREKSGVIAMFRTQVSVAALALIFVASSSFGADAPSPPAMNPSAHYAPRAQVIRETVSVESPRQASRLEPSAEDMARARKAAEQRRPASERVTTYESPKGTVGGRTRIEEYHDQNNRVTEVRVTSGITEIPYTMENRSDRPIDTAPGQNSQSTLGTPKFIKFGW